MPAPALTLSRGAVRVGLQGGVDEGVGGGRDSVAAAELDDLAGEPRQFEAVAAQPNRCPSMSCDGPASTTSSRASCRRCRAAGEPLRHGRPPPFHLTRPRTVLRDPGRARHLPSGRRVSALRSDNGTSSANFSQIGTLTSGLSTPSNPPARQRSRRRCPRSLASAVESAKGHLLIGSGLADDAGRDDRAGDKRGAAHDRLRPEDRNQPVGGIDPVLQRDHRGFGSDDRADRSPAVSTSHSLTANST